MKRRDVRTYTVKPEDNLWSISERFYGEGEHWDSIYAENTCEIGSNPDYLETGLVLRISARPLSYVQIVENMIGYYESVVEKARVNSEEPPREVGLLFKYQDILIRIRLVQGFIIAMLLLLLFLVFG